MEDSETAIGENPVHNVEIVSFQVSAKQLIDIFYPPLTTNLKIAPR